MLESEENDTENEILYNNTDATQVFEFDEESSDDDENEVQVINSTLILNNDKRIFKSLNEDTDMKEINIDFSETESDFHFGEQMTLNKTRHGTRKLMKKKTEKRYINSDKKRASDTISSYCGGFAFFSFKILFGFVDVFQGFRFDRPYCSFPLTKYDRRFYEINGMTGNSEENNSNLLRMNGLTNDMNNLNSKKDMFELGTNYNSEDENLFNRIRENLSEEEREEQKKLDDARKTKEVEEKIKKLEQDLTLFEEERKQFEQEKILFANTKKVTDLTSSDSDSEIESETLGTLENTPSKLSNNETENENEEKIETQNENKYIENEVRDDDDKIETQNESSTSVDFFNRPNNVPPPDSDNGGIEEKIPEKHQKSIKLGDFFGSVVNNNKKNDDNIQNVVYDESESEGKRSFAVKSENKVDQVKNKAGGVVVHENITQKQMKEAISKLHKKNEIIRQTNIFESQYFMRLNVFNILLHNQIVPLINMHQTYQRKNINLPHIKDVIVCLNVLKKDISHLIEKYKETRKTIESEKKSASGQIKSLYVVCSRPMGDYIQEMDVQLNSSGKKRNNTKSNSDGNKTALFDINNKVINSDSSSSAKSDDGALRSSRPDISYIDAKRRKNIFDKYIDQFKKKRKRRNVMLPDAPERPDVYLKEINVS